MLRHHGQRDISETAFVCGNPYVTIEETVGNKELHNFPTTIAIGLCAVMNNGQMSRKEIHRVEYVGNGASRIVYGIEGIPDKLVKVQLGQWAAKSNGSEWDNAFNEVFGRYLPKFYSLSTCSLGKFSYAILLVDRVPNVLAKWMKEKVKEPPSANVFHEVLRRLRSSFDLAKNICDDAQFSVHDLHWENVGFYATRNSCLLLDAEAFTPKDGKKQIGQEA